MPPDAQNRQSSYVGTTLFGTSYNVKVVYESSFSAFCDAVTAVYAATQAEECPWGVDCGPFAVETVSCYSDVDGVWCACTDTPPPDAQLWVFQAASRWHACLPAALRSPLSGMTAEAFMDMRYVFHSCSPSEQHIRLQDLRALYTRLGAHFDISFSRSSAKYSEWETLCHNAAAISSVRDVARRLRADTTESNTNSPEAKSSVDATPALSPKADESDKMLTGTLGRLQVERMRYKSTIERIRSESRVPEPSPHKNTRPQVRTLSPTEKRDERDRCVSMPQSEFSYYTRRGASEARGASVSSAGTDFAHMPRNGTTFGASDSQQRQPQGRDVTGLEELIRVSRARRQEEEAALNKLHKPGGVDVSEGIRGKSEGTPMRHVSMSAEVHRSGVKPVAALDEGSAVQKRQYASGAAGAASADTLATPISTSTRLASEARTEASTTSTYRRDKDTKWGEEFDVLEKAIATARQRRQEMASVSPVSAA